MSRNALRPLLPLAAVAALAFAGCGGADDTTGSSGDSGSSGGSKQVSLVAYSTPEVVYNEILPAFKQTDAGKDVAFKSSYGASWGGPDGTIERLKPSRRCTTSPSVHAGFSRTSDMPGAD